MFGKNEIVGRRFFKETPPGVLHVTSLFFTLQGEGPKAGQPAVFARLAKCNLACSFCFPSHYPISVRGKGTMRLDEVAVGDQLLTLDDKLKPAYTTVKASNSRWVSAKDLVEVIYDDDGRRRSLVVTRDHPFNVKGSGFVNAEDLQAGQVVHHLPGSERVAARMAIDNPMRDTFTSRKVSKNLRKQYREGSLIAYPRDFAWRASQSRRMQNKNPMHNSATVKQVAESKTYKKSSLEKAVHRLLRKTGYSVTYTGNRKGWMIGSDSVGYHRPDFVFDGTKKILEVYDQSYLYYTDHRHTPEGERAYRKSRRQHYRKFGFDVQFVTAQDLGLRGFYKNVNSINETTERKIDAFLSNGIRIIEVREPDTKQINAPYTKAGTYLDGKVKVTNFTCDGNNTFCMRGIHTHNCDTFFDAGSPMTFSEVFNRIYGVVNSWYNDQGKSTPLSTMPYSMAVHEEEKPVAVYNVGLVVTGGEPTLQKNLTAFLEQAQGLFAWTQIESNGTMSVALPKSTILVCSPKCAEKDGRATHYLEPSQDVFDRADCLKFVLSADPNSPYHTIPSWAFAWRYATKRPIYISPMNVYNDVPHKAKLLRATKDDITLEERSSVDEVISFWEPGLLNMEQNQRNHEYAARYCMEHNLQLNLQMHLYASLA